MLRCRPQLHLFLLAGIVLSRTVPAGAEDSAPARFHHVHLNVTDPKSSIKFYSRVFGATPTKYRGVADALFTERSFLLLNKVDTPPETKLNTGIWHIGWGGVDVKNEFEWWKNHGVDIHTPLSPLPGSDNYYMYINGPDKELIEINTMGHHRFAHVHFFCTDVNETVGWYAKNLGLKPLRPKVEKPKGNMSTLAGIWINVIPCDNVTMIFFGKPDVTPAPPWWPDEPLKEIQPTRGRPIDHIAFSYRDIEPVFERMKAAGVEIVEPITMHDDIKTKSFTVLAPEKVTIEIVEAKPIPEGVWED
ncbi:MAG TPA: VOC family protein [Pirellulales bacterium]|jgi:catechol 2,3-dioxygenase-like lactoylglutathione lyase family enzyme